MGLRPNDAKYDVLLNTKADSVMLMIFWYIHKSFWALLLLGILIGMVFGDTRNALFNIGNTKSLLPEVTPTFKGLLIAVAYKLISDNLFVLTAYPILKKRKLHLQDKASDGMLHFYDQWRNLRGISTLRWTHAVRQQAMLQFDTKFLQGDTINHSISIATFCLLALCIIMLVN